MIVALKGPSASALTAGILLLSRARTRGHRLEVEIVGDPSDLAAVEGPAIVHSHVLASCGVGRDIGSGALVIVPGRARDPLALSLSPDGLEEWFYVDRSGDGLHEATRQFVTLCRDKRPAERDLGRQLRLAMGALGCSPEPAVLDLLFASPAPPMMRLALALRAGRAMSGGRGTSITRYLAGGTAAVPDPLPADAAELRAAWDDGRMAAMLDRLSLSVRDAAEDWVKGITHLGPEYAVLQGALAEVLTPLSGLPPQGMLPPLPPSTDAVAVGLGAALGATGSASGAGSSSGAGVSSDAAHGLVDIFRFLGGRFNPSASYPIPVAGAPPPPDRLGRWRWLCAAAKAAVETADALWAQAMDPPQ